jgi:hypothetical protein
MDGLCALKLRVMHDSGRAAKSAAEQVPGGPLHCMARSDIAGGRGMRPGGAGAMVGAMVGSRCAKVISA